MSDPLTEGQYDGSSSVAANVRDNGRKKFTS